MALHLVHVIAQLRFGAGRYVVDTAIAQHARHPGRVAVVLSDDADGPWVSDAALIAELTGAGVAVHRAGDFFHRDAAALKAAAAAMRAAVCGPSGRWAPDTIVHAHTAMGAAVARWAGAPRVVVTCHGWGPGRPAEFDLQDALAYSLCDVVSSPSERWAEVVRTKCAVTDVPVVPYGLSLTRVPPRSAAVSEVPRIVCVGELSYRKGQDLLLDAMPAVWARVPQAELHFIGDGEARETLRAHARTVDPSGQRVVFHGQHQDAGAQVGTFDIFALATRSDNQPVAIIEAMAAGVPVVATRVGGIADLVESARCGFVVPPGNVYELGMALSVLAESGDAARRELGALGPAVARARFDIASHVDALDRLYAGQWSRPSQPFAGVSADTPLRLYVGCDTDHRSGWVNIDVRADVAPDVVTTAHELGMFQDGSVDTIEACHLLEHLPLHEARAAFKEWARVLKPDGELLLELPNFDACVTRLGDAHDSQGHDLAMVGIYGWPPDVARAGAALSHKWGWSPATLGRELAAVGFTTVHEQPITQTWRPAARINRDFRIRAVRAAQAERAA